MAKPFFLQQRGSGIALPYAHFLGNAGCNLLLHPCDESVELAKPAEVGYRLPRTCLRLTLHDRYVAPWSNSSLHDFKQVVAEALGDLCAVLPIHRYEHYRRFTAATQLLRVKGMEGSISGFADEHDGGR
jgi:hypothetical protein